MSTKDTSSSISSIDDPRASRSVLRLVSVSLPADQVGVWGTAPLALPTTEDPNPRPRTGHRLSTGRPVHPGVSRLVTFRGVQSEEGALANQTRATAAPQVTPATHLSNIDPDLHSPDHRRLAKSQWHASPQAQRA